ncbi:MAG: glycosyltransferase [Cellulomonadaceae bacterium]|nr:glycosyltransferase [Cellulomonadaceae bacterium]
MNTATGPDAPDSAPCVDVSVVIPVYRGAMTLPTLVEEMAALTRPTDSPDGNSFRVRELVLVWDHGPDESDRVIAELVATYDWVRAVWLSRNFGQLPATVAGLAATTSEWVVTMDEDGQHDPRDIGRLVDTALREGVDLVYANPTNLPPHSAVRNLGSRLAKGVVLRALVGTTPTPFHSFRLLRGEHARAVAAYCGPGVFLDIALTWVVGRSMQCPVTMRSEGRAATSYNMRRLVSHFWRLVLSSGNRPLRVMSAVGVATAVLGLLLAVVLIVQRLFGGVDVQGWTSVIVAVLVLGGLILTSLGVIAEYVGLAASMSMGRPLFVAVSAPERSRREQAQRA